MILGVGVCVCHFWNHIFILYRLEVLVPCVDLIGKGGGGHVLIEKAYVQKELAAGTRLKLGVPC
jgi:hypothetical protein